MKIIHTISIIILSLLLGAAGVVAQNREPDRGTAPRMRGIQLLSPTIKDNATAKGRGVALLAPGGLEQSYSLILPLNSGVKGQVLTITAKNSNDAVTAWTTPLTDSTGWMLMGNGGTGSSGALGATPTGDRLGTTNAVDLRLVSNNITRMILATDGSIAMAGAMTINTVGTAPTTIGNATGNFALTSSNLNITTAGVISDLAGDVEVNDNLNITGSLTSSGLITGNAGATIAGPTLVNTSGTASTTIGNATGNFALTSSNLNITTAGVISDLVGNVTINDNLDVTGLIAGTAGATISGAVNINTTGTLSTNIGSSTSATTIVGATNINATGTSLTTIGNTGSTVAIGSLSSSAKGAVAGGYDRIVIANSNGTLDQASISSVVAAGVAGSAWALAGNSITDATTQFLGTTSSQPLVIRTNNTEKMRILANGRVGIGATSPSATLEVQASGSDEVFGFKRSNGTSVLKADVLGRVLINTTDAGGWLTVKGSGGNGGNLQLQSMTDVKWEVAAGNTSGPDGTAGFSIWGNWSNGLGSGTLRFGIDTNGRTGIGTHTVYDAMLDVRNNVAASNVLNLRGASSQSANYVTIENSAGLDLLTVKSTGALSLEPTGTAAGNTNELRFVELAANGTNYIGFKASDNIAANVIWTLPSGDGSNGQVISTNGSGTLSWTTPLTASNGWSTAGNDITSSSGALGAAPTGSFLGTTSTSTAKDLRIATNGLTRIIVGSDGAVTMGGTLGVTGATTLSSTLGVTGLITGNAGATLTGATTINTTGTALTSIGNTGAGVTIGRLATTLNTSVPSGADRIVLATSTGALDQASIASVVAAGLTNQAVTSFSASGTGLTPSSATTGAVTLGGTLDVDNGGTGRASATAYMPIVGGTTATGAQQSVAAGSTTGQAMLYQGASAVPVFGAVNLAGGTNIVTGTLPVANGGTGASTLTGIVIGNGTSALTATSLSSGISGVLSDETGSGSLVFANGPTLTTLTVSSGGAAITGATTINTTGTALTTIGNTGSSVVIGSMGSTAKGSLTGGFDRIVIANSNGTLDQASISSVVATGVAGSAWALAGNNITDATTQFLGTTSSQPLVLRTANTEKMRVTSDGLVGIGTQAPSAPLDVRTATTGTILSGTNSANGASFSFVTDAGNRASLTVTGGSSGTAAGAYFTAIGREEAWFNVVANLNTAGLRVMRFGNSSNGVTNAFAIQLLNDAQNAVISTPFRVQNAAPTNSFVVGADGNVGIGVSVPASRLDVAGTVGATGLATLSGGLTVTGATNINTAGATATNIGTGTSTGAVTIGNASNTGGVTIATQGTTGRLALTGIPTGTTDDVLLVNSTNGQVSRVTQANLLANAGWALTGNNLGTVTAVLGSAPSGPFLGTTSGNTQSLQIATNNAVRMIVTSAGAVSMGSTLNVSGLITGSLGATISGAATSINASSNFNTDINTGSSTGIVSIGNAASTTNILGATNINTTGTALTTIGNTGSAVTIGSIATTLKTSVGANDRIVLATSNGTLDQASISSVVAAGVAGSAWALAGNSGTTNGGTLGSAPTGSVVGTTGTAANARDLSFVTNNVIQMQISTAGVVSTRNDVIVNGLRVGRGAGSVASNTAVGSDALLVNTTGANNTAIGFRTLYAATTGTNNTAIGYQALTGNTTGASNVAIGTSALQSNTAGLYNTAVGVAAGRGLTGSSNTAIGWGALDANNSGSGNVAIGFEAGYNESGSNKLYIANSASNNLIYGDFSAGVVSINAGATPSAPGASLQVNAFNASTKGMVVKGAASASANLFEAQNSAGTALVSISSAGLITGTAGINLSGSTSPLQANGSAGTTGQVLTSAGAGATPTWTSPQAAAGIKSKGRSPAQTNVTSFAITGITNLDADDGISVTLEGDGTGLSLPSYYVVRTTGASGTVTVYFSSGYSGRVTWVVID